jgi:hypothetical protein
MCVRYPHCPLDNNAIAIVLVAGEGAGFDLCVTGAQASLVVTQPERKANPPIASYFLKSTGPNRMEAPHRLANFYVHY